MCLRHAIWGFSGRDKEKNMSVSIGYIYIRAERLQADRFQQNLAHLTLPIHLIALISEGV